ncbi:MAG TPA: hypothetical protein VMR54_15680 [Thermoanaerobaculia bacterium]|nr:hypothetical protein [Thermoanaerobaculia bacterium]
MEGRDAGKIKVTKKDGDVGDFKEAGGFLWRHSIQLGAKDRPERQTITVSKIAINPTIDDARFKMPAPMPAEAPKDEGHVREAR